jgi:hypothetical protein
MLHLFRKIYVCPDFLVDNSKKRIIVSSTDGVAQQSNLNTIKQAVKSFDELITIYKNWPGLLASLEYEEKLRFYVDMQAFDKFFVHWVKTIFSDLTKELAYCMYNSYVQRLTIHFPAIVLNRSFLDYNKSKMQALHFTEQELFYELFDSITPWADEQARTKWVADHIEDISIEWHLANYYNDPKHLAVFRDKYLYVLNKALAIEVSEWYFYVTKYFMQPNVKQAFDIDIKWSDPNWRAKLKAHPKIGWMFDDEFKFITRDAAYFAAHVDKILELGKFLQDFWFKDIQIDDKTRLLDEDYFESNHAHFVFDTLRTLVKHKDTLSTEDIDKIIASDFEKENVSIIFDVLTHIQKWNPYIIQLVYELKNTKDSRLTQLVIK